MLGPGRGNRLVEVLLQDTESLAQASGAPWLHVSRQEGSKDRDQALTPHHRVEVKNSTALFLL